jgi:HK97 gp10 family phage protein
MTVKVEGLREIDRQLTRLKEGTAKGALRRSLRRSAKPMADLMQANAPRLSGNMADSVKITSKLSPRQASQHRKMFADMRSAVELHVGPGPYPQAITQEFGTYFHEPQPFVRPAWDADKMAMLERLKADLWSEITRTINRAAARGTLLR